MLLLVKISSEQVAAAVVLRLAVLHLNKSVLVVVDLRREGSS